MLPSFETNLSSATGLSERDLYLDLLKRVLINWIYLESEIIDLRPYSKEDAGVISRIKRALTLYLRNYRWVRTRKREVSKPKRLLGLDWPMYAHSMTGLSRLNNLEKCCKSVLDENIAGDWIETGCWRGGSSIFMAGVLRIFDESDRRVFVCDSFEGLPKPDENYPEDAQDKHHQWGDILGVTKEQVEENFRRYGLLSRQVHFIKGWFKDTLRFIDSEQFSLIRLDGDMYESTYTALDALYPKLSSGGFLIIDDYYALDNCRKAVDDYFEKEGIPFEINRIDDSGGFLRKTLPNHS